MSAKFMYPLSDENPDLQKQIGCMNGLFHHFLGSRRFATPSHKCLPPGSIGKHGTEAKIASQRIKENNLKKTAKENQRLSSESPRTSSSSYSSADCTKASRLDQHRSSSSQTSFPEIPKQEISNEQSTVYLQSCQHSVNLRNVVKDCIYREARGLSVKTGMKADAGQHQTLKYIDSPRPLQSPKPALTRKINLEVPRTANGRNDGSLTFVARDARRFSYDGRGSHDAVKVKLKDQPRLSLDSREISTKGSTNHMDCNEMRSRQQEPGSGKGPSSIVAKLMGLEILKDDLPSFSLRIDENSKNRVSCSPRNSKTEPSSPGSTNADSKKSIATRCPNEPAPWKHMDGSIVQTSASKCRETLPKSPNPSLTVYGEIEKRLAELEFQKSGKDLRALKQILEAMQKSKQMVGTRKDDQASIFVSQANSVLGQSSEAPNLRKLQSSNSVSAIVKGTSSPTRLKSPVKITKPANCIENASNSSSSVVATSSLSRIRTRSSPAEVGNEKVDKRPYKELTLRPNSPKHPSCRPQPNTTPRTLTLNQTSKELSPIAGENPKLAMSSETTCLKKKLELEKNPRLTHPASEQSRSRRQSSRIQAESGLPHWNSRNKSHDLQRRDDQTSDISSDMTDLSHQGDGSSMQFKSNSSAATYGDIEVTSMNSSHNGSVSQKQEKNHKISTTEPPNTVMEQPSPVSVLDAAFYGDESPSPVKKKSNPFKDYEGLIADEAEWSLSHKQLTFGEVNEIRVRKLVKQSSEIDKPCVVEDRKPKRQDVVRDSCSDIDKLPTVSSTRLDDEINSVQSILMGDLKVGAIDWSKCKSEIPWVVLDVERLIFKDLICEIISGEAANYRRLFVK
ncbi:Tip elongation aberrant 1 [Gossypium arboreum]|uniref:Tip elongation aberrant 1 n=2 Tax=Gossypium arboreum TaxID=29729 RepID=A0A0B0P7N6_GOSAR|nr:hypothetical protein PVK06_037711 [Gossypium arboreum]KHG21075.1 Tip elongation aberrant 1 [Gossypium arboreum]